MKPNMFVIILLAIAASPGLVSGAEAEAGFVAIKALGSLNGQALACSEPQAAARAKSLMLAHAPKTPRYGTAYEEATQAAYLAQTRSADACPATIHLTDRLNQLALELSASLPVAGPEAK